MVFPAEVLSKYVSPLAVNVIPLISVREPYIFSVFALYVKVGLLVAPVQVILRQEAVATFIVTV